MTFDIGSGATKYYVAQINRCTKKIVKIVDSNSFPFAFKGRLIKSANNRFSPQDRADFIHKLKPLIDKYHPDQINSVATSAFRTAKNGKQFAASINQEIPINLIVISQKEEAMLGFHAVKAKLATLKNFLYWDIGGGSMQIIKNSHSSQQLYKGKIGAVSFKELVIKKIFSGKRKSPNPLKNNYVRAIKLAKNFALKTLPKSFPSPGINTFGIGGVHQYAILKNNKQHGDSYTANELLQWLKRKSKLTDKEIGGKYATTDVTNIALVLGFMQALKISKVTVIPNINMAYALLYK
jgi:exopolyphosphatase/guanosine-5'-triphosphate,3'-diphosphate pyrophosphatase